MNGRWMTTLALALAVALPAAALAQTTTEKAGDKAGDKVERTSASAMGTVKDSWITAKTEIALYADDRVSSTGINVDTANGTVHLRGNVASADEKRAAETVAKGIDGVRSVRNDLQVVPAGERRMVESKDGDLKDAVERRIKQDARLKGADIDVRVDRGVVTLTGDV